jgi:hypothetical protein
MEPKDDQIYAFDGIIASLAGSSRLGLGELSSPEMQCWIARMFLFHFIEKLAQKELRELRDGCRDSFRSLRELGRKMLPHDNSDFPPVVITTEIENGFSSRVHYVEDWRSLTEAAAHFSAAEMLRAKLSSWAEKYSLASQWFLDAAWRMICHWFKSADTPKQLIWRLPAIFAVRVDGGKQLSGLGFPGNNKFRPYLVPPGIRAEIPALPPYDPVGMTRSEYLDRVHWLAAEYCELQEAGYKKLNLVPTRQLRAKSGSPWVHWAWFVKYQVKRLNAEEIAKASAKSNIDASTVYRGVQNVAKLVDLPLRKKNQRRRANLK